MNTSSSFIKGKIFRRSKLYSNQIFPHTINLYNEKFDWLIIVDPIWLVWNTYISHSLTDSLTHWLTDLSTTHNILDAPTKRYFFYKKITQKWRSLKHFNRTERNLKYLQKVTFLSCPAHFHTHFYMARVLSWFIFKLFSHFDWFSSMIF